MRALLLLAAICLAACASPASGPSERPPVERERIEASPPDWTLTATQASRCEQLGGFVEKAGLVGAERCTYPYADGGTVCTDAADCDGLCMAPRDAVFDRQTTGLCQVNDNPFGCYAEVREGKATPTLCVD